MDVLPLAIFNLLVIFLIVLFNKRPQCFGEFRSCFLRFDISQHFYIFVIIYVAIVSYSFTIMFGKSASKFMPGLLVLVFLSIIIFNICKYPYWYPINQPRIYLLYGFGTLLICCIIVQNMIEVYFLKNYLPAIIVGIQVILLFITGYYLFQSIKL